MRFIIFILLCTQHVYAQLHDNTWLFGYGGPPPGNKFGITKIQFNEGNPDISELIEAETQTSGITQGGVPAQTGKVIIAH